MLAPPGYGEGQLELLSPIHWKAWRLERVAVGTNDAEVQAAYEGDVISFKLRVLWSEMCGFGQEHGRRWCERARTATRRVKGVLIVDSKGAYDSVTKSESANLGLANSRVAVRAYAIKESMRDPNLSFVNSADL